MFFFVVKVCKVPFSAALGLFTTQVLPGAVLLSPLVLVGTWVGLHSAARLRQTSFDRLVLGASAVSALILVLT